MFRITIEATGLCNLGASDDLTEFISSVIEPNTVVLKAPSNFATLAMEDIEEIASMCDPEQLKRVRPIFVLAYHHYRMEQAVHEIIGRHLLAEAKKLGVGEDEWETLKTIALKR